jgi:hypothetical protein
VRDLIGFLTGGSFLLGLGLLPVQFALWLYRGTSVPMDLVTVALKMGAHGWIENPASWFGAYNLLGRTHVSLALWILTFIGWCAYKVSDPEIWAAEPSKAT